MSSMYMSIGHDEHNVVVHFEHHAAELGDYENPPQSESVTVEAVILDYVDIMDDLTPNELDQVEQNIFDSFDFELLEPDYERDE